VSQSHNVNGTAGNDVIVVRGTGSHIHARGGNDLVCGSDGPDFLYDGKGHDRFYGGAGQDFLEQRSVERDFFDGGPGFDAVDYIARSVDQYVDLGSRRAVNGAPGEHDTLLSVGSVYTGSGNDVLVAGDEPNTDGHSFPAFSAYYLVAGAGDDVITGGPLGDLIAGGPGNDVIDARGGRDFIDATDDTGIDGYQHYADRVDGGHDHESDVAVCDELDVLVRISETRGC
jgi:Ca2+-binding RTX toxin-like protein